jgi:hypothetical protein
VRLLEQLADETPSRLVVLLGARSTEGPCFAGSRLSNPAAWDVHRAKVFGRCEATTGIAPFERLVAQVMTQEPYRSARRVLWVVDHA